MAAYFSLTNYDGLMPFNQARFVGIANYAAIFRQPAFVESLLITVKYAILVVPMVLLASLLLAWMQTAFLKQRIYRALIYVPSTISAIIVGIIWRWFFDSDFGIINSMLTGFGFPIVRWFEDPNLAFLVVMIATIWSRTGYFMVLFIAAMENIPGQYYEAANLDGANAGQSFLHITVPLLKPTTFLVFILNFIDSFRLYAMTYSLTRGGPMRATTLLVQHIYETSFISFRMNLGNAMSMVLFVMVLVFTILQYKIGSGGEIK